MTECGHENCEKETLVEAAALAAASQVLNDSELRRVCEVESDGAVPDYRSERHTVEVKKLASEPFERFAAAYRNSAGVFSISSLTKTWMVSPNTTEASFAIKDRHLETPLINKLAKKLTPLLHELEDRKISSFRELVGIEQRALFEASSADPEEPAPSLASRIVEILGPRPTCDAIDDIKGVPHGIVLSHRQESTRVFDLDATVGDVIQAWMEVSSENMRASMEGERSGQVRCGVVVAPDYGFGLKLIRSLSEDFPDLSEVPSGALKLPDELDILIVVAGDQAISFRKSTGAWERARLNAG